MYISRLVPSYTEYRWAGILVTCYRGWCDDRSMTGSNFTTVSFFQSPFTATRNTEPNMSTTVKTIADCLNVAAAKVFTFSEDRSIAVCLCSVLLPAVYFL